MIYKGMVCQWCGATFTAQKSSTKYCSKRCANLANKQRMREMTQTIVDSHNTVKKEREAARHESEILSPVLLAEFLGVSRSTAYDYIAKGVVKAIRIGKRKTYIRRTDVIAIFDAPSMIICRNTPAPAKAVDDRSCAAAPNVAGAPNRKEDGSSIKGGKPGDEERYTTAREVAERYDLSFAGADKILKGSGITLIERKGKHYYFQHEVEALFRKREAESHPEISEWYTSADIQKKFKLAAATIWAIASSYGIPTKRVHRVTYYSKIHFDRVRGIKTPEAELWYTVPEAMEKYHQSRDQVYNVLRYNNINRVQVGRIVKFRRSEYDDAMKFITTTR